MTQRDGRETYFTAVSNHVAPALWSGMADGNLITREEPRNYRRSTHDYETKNPPGGDSQGRYVRGI